MVSKTKLTSKSPLISVIIPAFNAEKYLPHALESILNQSYRNFECIIIDDKSRDHTAEICQKYKKMDSRIIFLQNKTNFKMARTLNIGIRASRGKYIARMDADDWSYPDRLEKQLAYMEKHQKVGILGGSMEIIDKNEKRIGRRDYVCTDRQIRAKLFRYSPFSHPLVMIRKSVLDKVGLYDPDYNPAEDYELYFRIGAVSKFANEKDVLLKYRIVDNSMTTGSTEKMERKTLAVRNKYKTGYGYTMSQTDKIITYLHSFSLSFIPIPAPIKIRLFNLIRNTK